MLVETGRNEGLILDKKKGLLIRNENKACLLGEHLIQGFEKPVADILDKDITDRKTYTRSNKRAHEAASQISQMLCQHLFLKIFHTTGSKIEINT